MKCGWLRQSSYEVELPNLRFLKHKLVANIQGISALLSVRLERKLGDLPAAVLKEIQGAIGYTLDIKIEL